MPPPPLLRRDPLGRQLRGDLLQGQPLRLEGLHAGIGGSRIIGVCRWLPRGLPGWLPVAAAASRAVKRWSKPSRRSLMAAALAATLAAEWTRLSALAAVVAATDGGRGSPDGGSPPK